MDETFSARGIIIKRRPIKNNDLTVTVYTLERGRLELLARGAQKFKAKSTAHLEPFNLVSLMIIRGKSQNYLGSAIAIDCFADLKSDFNKIKVAGAGLNLFEKLIKGEEADPEIFALLMNFLDNLNKTKGKDDFIYLIFAFKLICLLGYTPDLESGMRDRVLRGECPLTISDNCIKMLKLMIRDDFLTLLKIDPESVFPETERFVNLLIKNLY